MKVLTFFAAIILTMSGQFSEASDCDFYEKQDGKHSCKGNANYLKSYGAKYCNHFTALAKDKESSKNLKSWITSTRACLQDMLVESKDRHSWKCQTLKEFAFDIHPACYKVFGVCSLKAKDLIKVGKVIAKNDFVTDFEREKRATILQISNVSITCLSASKTLSDSGELFYNMFIKSKVRAAAEAVKAALEIIDLAPDTIKKMEEYFARVVSSMSSSGDKKEDNVSTNAVKTFSTIASSKYGHMDSIDWAKQTPTNAATNEIAIIKNKLSTGLTLGDLRRGLATARAMTSSAK